MAFQRETPDRYNISAHKSKKGGNIGRFFSLKFVLLGFIQQEKLQHRELLINHGILFYIFLLIKNVLF
jgi:hypothetical protein